MLAEERDLGLRCGQSSMGARWAYLREQRYGEAAKICLTHSLCV